MHLAAHRSTPHHCLSGDDFGDDADCDDLDDDDYDHDNDDDDDGKNVTFEQWAVVARKWNIGCRWSLWLILHKPDKPTLVMMTTMMVMMMVVMMITMIMIMMMTLVVALKVLKKCAGELGIIFIGAIHTF